MIKIHNKIVHGGPQLKVPDHQSFGKYVVDKLLEYFENEEKIALINAHSHEKYTYKELLQQIVSIATGLKAFGLKLGDVIAICGENSCEFVAAAIATVCIGATLTTINVKDTKNNTLHALSLSKPRLVFCSIYALELKLDIFQEASCVEFIVQLSYKEAPHVGMNLGDLTKEECDVHEFEPTMVDGKTDTAFILYSSGTTGLPKGVMITHLNALHAALTYNYSSKNNARILTVLPWYHTYGLMSTIQHVCSGDLVVYLTAFKPDEYIKTIETYKITEILIVPPIAVQLAKSSVVKQYDLSSLNLVWSASAPLSVDIIRQAIKNLPNCNKLLQGFGMTETTMAVFKEPYDRPGKLGSCGQPLPGVMAKVVDVDFREKLGPNEKGEICVKGPSIMKGYIINETATQDVFDEEGYLKSGDIGYYDNEGRFYIVDRIKEIMKYKGQQVAPAAIESVVLQHPGVAECGVVGKPDELAGDLPTAFVVPKPGVTLTEQDILDFTTSKLSPSSRLRGGVIFVEEIPRNGSGKILRRVLREILQKKLVDINKSY